MMNLREALINKNNIRNVKENDYFIYITASFDTVKCLYRELKEYEIPNYAFHMWLLSKSQINEIYKNHKEVREDTLSKLYKVSSRIDLEEIKKSSFKWDLPKFIEKFGLILTPNLA